MREIKFRAWDKKEKEMFYEFYIRAWDGKPIQMDWKGHELNLDDLILMQFTGLHDKNGKEIYEGDIIEFGIVVIFKDGAFRIDVDSTPLQEWIWKRQRSREDTEVIGNIYENPRKTKKLI